MKQEHTITNVSQYLELIRENNYYHFIFRGQNEAYGGIQASGFRPYKGGWYTDTFYDIEGMKKEFYNKVIRRLSPDEREHFLAFCQHHGLPTNIVDFTRSPLVALFFACNGKNQPTESGKPNNYAEIYLIDKTRLIDITDLLVKSKNENFFEVLVENVDVQKEILVKIEQLFLENTGEFIHWIKNLIECYENNHLDIYGDRNIDINEDDELDSEETSGQCYSLTDYKDKIKNDGVNSLKELYIYVSSEIEDENITHSDNYYINDLEYGYYCNEAIGAKIYLALLINLLQIFINIKERIDIRLDIYFTYQPPDLFDRITNQKGLFIYQPYLYGVESVYKYGVLNYQSIIPDITVKVENYNNILKELNYLGINLESIYGDFDNIARSIKLNNDLLFPEKVKAKFSTY
ncbi:FRG domain-containing protein [Paenibacillus hodogayensis]|uniref:FRG domain-containing protein n=1 Tax=Paenibacillus hodogayensis TaxID=279208 RepID=A0ABV5VSF6_9BACL